MSTLAKARLMVFTLFLSIPIYFLLLSWFSPIKPVIFNDLFLDLILHILLTPILLSTPLMFIIYIYRDHTANTILHMEQTTTLIPLRWKIFYGFNTIVVLYFIALPLISPPLLMISCLLIAGRIAARLTKNQQTPDKKPWVLSIVFFIILGVPSFLIIINFITIYHPLYVWLLEQWIYYLDRIYTITTLLLNALAGGTVLWLFYDRAIITETRDIGLTLTEPPTWSIRTIEFVLFIILLGLWLPEFGNIAWIPIISSRISFFLVLLFTIIKIISGIQSKKTSPGLIGLLWAMMFLLIYILEITTPILTTILILVAALIYTLAFVHSLRSATVFQE